MQPAVPASFKHALKCESNASNTVFIEVYEKCTFYGFVNAEREIKLKRE